MAGKLGGKWREKISIIARLRAFPSYIADPNVSKFKKGIIFLLIIYILSPIDLVPEAIIPLVGFLDDLGILTLLSGWMYGELGEYKRAKDSE